MDKIVAFISLILVLLLVNISILKKENHLANGEVVYLALAPVDPRSLMQGDYMALRFEISNDIYRALQDYDEYGNRTYSIDAEDGYVIVKLDDKKIASFKTLYANQKLSDDELLMHYRIRGGEVKFATNAFFFQEGTAKYYERARYGEFRVDDSGELLLVGMYDENLTKLEAPMDAIN
ncbi:MAG: GDYXXLXY domain-containing protein [Campylobacterales bacterium]|nr:GDYXXLXY domain-containing protein [Campylobacterales bacterium]